MMDTKAPTATPSTITATEATTSKYGSLNVRQAARPSRHSLQAATKVQEFESLELHDVKRVTITRRSVSCFEFASDERRYRTIRIGEGSEELRQLAQANVSELVKTASSSDFNNALLARKALCFRKIWTPEGEYVCASPSR